MYFKNETILILADEVVLLPLRFFECALTFYLLKAMKILLGRAVFPFVAEYHLDCFCGAEKKSSSKAKIRVDLVLIK